MQITPSQDGRASPRHREASLDVRLTTRYSLRARIHGGECGTLYRADDTHFGVPVALRVLPASASSDPSVAARLHARIQANESLRHAAPDSFDVIDTGVGSDGRRFVVTALIPDPSLAHRLANHGPLPWRQVQPLIVRACQLIHLSHQHGQLRLDLQTRHLFPIRDKTQTANLRLLSPGLGDALGSAWWLRHAPLATATQLAYCAPEQCSGDPLDARTDVYAVGVIMFELLSGHRPFADIRSARLCGRHLFEPAPPLSVSATLPQTVATIVARALAKDPNERWPTMRALANAIAAIDFGPCDVSGVLEVPTTAPSPQASSTSMRIDPAAGHARSPAVRSVAPAPDESASAMAWAEILAAADEAVSTIANTRSAAPNAGDSGVFIPASLLRSGEAATQSQMHGLRAGLPDFDPADSLAATLVMPTALTRSSSGTPATTSTPSLGDSDATLSRAPHASHDSHDDLATAAVHRSDAALAIAGAQATPTVVARRGHGWLIVAAALVIVGAASFGLYPARRDDATGNSGDAGPTETVVAATIAAEHPVTPPPTTPTPAQVPELPQPREVATMAPVAAPLHRPRGPDPQPEPVSATPTLVPTPAPAAKPSQPVSDPESASPSAPTPATKPPSPSPDPEPPSTSPKPPSPGPEPAAEAKPSRSPTDPPPPPVVRKSTPGAHLPDAGHEPAALADDPERAAELLTQASRAASRGERALGLSLALQSYHTKASTDALHLAGALACQLGDAAKARWALQHLAADQRRPVEQACSAANVALEP